ncbi:DoxX family protein [Georgenia sp. SUBG003]|uniref:DoxX family protein n=1 Tax=Georgenia sp. SUBG003 TaxID=1497974 RepID=UPI000AAC5513
MQPLIVLVVVTLGLRAAGFAGVARLSSWPPAVRGGLAAMFVMTGTSHFVGMRAELISMVPPVLPEPGLLVTVTGVLELAGAVGLLVPRTVPWAAGGLAALLVVMFPANVYAAVSGAAMEGAQTMTLLPRTLLQLLFLAATLGVLRAYAPRRKGSVTGAAQDDLGTRPSSTVRVSSGGTH